MGADYGRAERVVAQHGVTGFLSVRAGAISRGEAALYSLGSARKTRVVVYDFLRRLFIYLG